MAVPVIREELVRSVGLDQKPVCRHVTERLALTLFSFVGEIPWQGKISPEIGQGRDHFGRATEGVQEETAIGPGFHTQDVQEAAPGLEAMNADRQIPFGSEAELPNEDFFLLLEIIVLDPAIQADLANSRRDLIEQFDQLCLPIRRAFLDVPGVIAE